MHWLQLARVCSGANSSTAHTDNPAHHHHPLRAMAMSVGALILAFGTVTTTLKQGIDTTRCSVCGEKWDTPHGLQCTSNINFCHEHNQPSCGCSNY